MLNNEERKCLRKPLLEKNIIDLYGDIDSEMTEYVRDAINVLQTRGCPDITIQICSAGGSAIAGWYIYDLLKWYPGKKIGKIVGGAAESAACNILQACDERQATSYSKIMVHRFTFDFIGFKPDLKNPKENDKWFAERKADWIKVEKKRLEVYTKRTKKTRKEIINLIHEEKSLTAEEALKIGLIDMII